MRSVMRRSSSLHFREIAALDKVNKIYGLELIGGFRAQALAQADREALRCLGFRRLAAEGFPCKPGGNPGMGLLPHSIRYAQALRSSAPLPRSLGCRKFTSPEPRHLQAYPSTLKPTNPEESVHLSRIFYRRLVESGKAKKVALCTVMRKLLVLMRALLVRETRYFLNFKTEGKPVKKSHEYHPWLRLIPKF